MSSVAAPAAASPAAASAAGEAVPKPRRVWIISAGWDLAYLVATPLAIVPLVLIAVRNWLTPSQVALAVISFASLGHHLPGFMRAYGDRELFERFRWRFLLAPPLLFCLALLFSPPAWLAGALDLPWQHLHGLELILLIWGTWHGLMQTYGFMRIYDVRLGETSLREARLDHALCLTMFVGGVVFSDSRMFGVANAMWQAGLPLFGAEALVGLRWIVGIAGAVVLAAYLWNLGQRYRAGLPFNYVKLLLALSTGWFYWYTGRLSTNLLIGLAMFEIYHAVQYFAIVWIYNRRLFERAGQQFGWLGFLFRDRVSMLCVYLGLIGAYSSIRYFTGDASQYIYTSNGNDAYQWLFALFVTSSLLHFYFDGFIWKVSEKPIQKNLVQKNLVQEPLADEPAEASLIERSVPALKHTAKWAIFSVLAAGLVLSERKILTQESAARETAVREALAGLTPKLPEAQILRSRDALADGHPQQAEELAEQALARRPRAVNIQRDAAVVFAATGNDRRARQLLEPLVAGNETDWQARVDLALLYERQQEFAPVEELLKQAIALQPELPEPRQRLAEFYVRQQRPAEAAEQMEQVARLLPDDYQTAVAWGTALRASGQEEQADEQLLRAAGLSEEPYQAYSDLGDYFDSRQEWKRAATAFEQCAALRPDEEEAYVNLASVQWNLGERTKAKATLREGMQKLPESELLRRAMKLLR